MNKKDVRQAQRVAMNEMIKVEHALANHLYPLFKSPMEGLGVIQEEVCEAKDETHGMDVCYRFFQESLRKGNKVGAVMGATDMALRARDAAIELIQVAAMCKKYIESEGAWE